MSKVQNDLQQIKAAIANLKELGEQLFTDEIAVLKQKAAELEAKIETETAELAVEAKEGLREIGAELKTIEQTVAQKYGQATAHVIEILLLVAICGKILGIY